MAITVFQDSTEAVGIYLKHIIQPHDSGMVQLLLDIVLSNSMSEEGEAIKWIIIII